MTRWWGAMGACTVLALMLCAAQQALAAPEVATQGADDGMTVVVGNGWRPGQRLVVSLGQDMYTAQVDSAGSFEVRTGVPFVGGATVPIAVRPFADTFRLTNLPPVSAPVGAPNGFAILFAQSLASGIQWLTAGCGAVVAVAASRRLLRRARSAD